MPGRADSESERYLIKEAWEPNCLQRRFGFKWPGSVCADPGCARILRLIFQTATAQVWGNVLPVWIGGGVRIKKKAFSFIYQYVVAEAASVEFGLLPKLLEPAST
jgi:hypothetical protein